MSLRSDLALDALEMAMFARGDQDLTQLVHHSNRGVQYVSIRYTERLGEAGVVNSIGSRGDSYDNALAESFNGLYTTELIRNKGAPTSSSPPSDTSTDSITDDSRRDGQDRTRRTGNHLLPSSREPQPL